MTPQSRWDDIAVKRRLQDTVREEALAYRALSATSDSSRVNFFSQFDDGVLIRRCSQQLVCCTVYLPTRMDE